MPTSSKPLPLSSLTAISPLDGRYHAETQALSAYVSEYALIKTRFEVEVSYLFALSSHTIIRAFSVKEKAILSELVQNFSLSDATRIKEHERTTKHDVKAVELFLRDCLAQTSLGETLEFVHIGLTSEDINNIAYRLLLKRATEAVCLPMLARIQDELASWAKNYKALPMLARTHGQAAVPTTLGKEFAVFAMRVHKQLTTLAKAHLTGKVSGAVGNFNALYAAYPTTDWEQFSHDFITSFDLEPNLFTTQINTYEDIVSYLQVYQRTNAILIDLAQDIWRYISDNWLIQEVKKDEVGSSTMPQKVNPILFENSEGNLGLANALIEHLTRKLPISRLQRDLSDSTVIRNLGTILGYSVLSYAYLLRGLARIRPNEEHIANDLNKDYAILTEAVQTILRREGVKDAYMLVKSLSRGEHIDQKQWQAWVNQLPSSDAVKKQLRELTPQTYLGHAVALTEQALQEIQEKPYL
jgi:adenylosuccinate lyase